MSESPHFPDDCPLVFSNILLYLYLFSDTTPINCDIWSDLGKQGDIVVVGNLVVLRIMGMPQAQLFQASSPTQEMTAQVMAVPQPFRQILRDRILGISLMYILLVGIFWISNIGRG